MSNRIDFYKTEKEYFKFLEDKKIEVWVLIKEYKNYQVSNWGKVRVKETGKEMKLEGKTGYLVVLLNNNGKRRSFSVHRLVAQAFLINPKPLDYDVIEHINGNKLDNNVCNLKWSTQSQKMKNHYQN